MMCRSIVLVVLVLVVHPPSAAAGAATRKATAPESPRLYVPAKPDSVSIESEAAPLIVPGRPAPIDSTARTPQRFAREQLALGIALEGVGELPGAILAYTNAVRADSTLPEASMRLGRIEMDRGRTQAAERLFREELRRNPNSTDASRDLALVLSKRGRHSEAVARLRTLTRLQPRRDEYWYALGLAYANAGRLREAEAPLRRAIALAPDRALEHRDLGVVLAASNRPREARQEYARAQALDTRDPSVWLNLGNLEARAGHADSALAAYARAERLDSTFTLAYEGELKALTTLDRRDAIADLYLRWVTARPDDDDLRLRTVRHLAALDRRDRALEIGRDGVRHNARSPLAHMILGMSLAAYGSTREAVAELRRAEALFREPHERDRVRQLIASMRQAAPDSLRAMFRADSLRHIGAR